MTTLSSSLLSLSRCGVLRALTMRPPLEQMRLRYFSNLTSVPFDGGGKRYEKSPMPLYPGVEVKMLELRPDNQYGDRVVKRMMPIQISGPMGIAQISIPNWLKLVHEQDQQSGDSTIHLDLADGFDPKDLPPDSKLTFKKIRAQWRSTRTHFHKKLKLIYAGNGKAARISFVSPKFPDHPEYDTFEARIEKGKIICTMKNAQGIVKKIDVNIGTRVKPSIETVPGGDGSMKEIVLAGLARDKVRDYRRVIERWRASIKELSDLPEMDDVENRYFKA